MSHYGPSSGNEGNGGGGNNNDRRPHNDAGGRRRGYNVKKRGGGGDQPRSRDREHFNGPRDDYHCDTSSAGWNFSGRRDDHPFSVQQQQQQQHRHHRDDLQRQSNQNPYERDAYLEDRPSRRYDREGKYYDESSRKDKDRDHRHRSNSKDSWKEYYDDGGWNCEECSEWNCHEQLRCSRCGSRNRNTDGDCVADECGRRRSSSTSNKRKKRKADKVVENEWPPCFQDATDDFVLDSRSGMFYEANSDFFYDPTSKLYYSNKKRSYFSYDADKKRFIPVDSSLDDNTATSNNDSKPSSSTEQDHLMLVPNGAKDMAVAEPQNKGIAIKINTVIPKQQKSEKKKKKRVESAASTNSTEKTPKSSGVAEPANKLQKQHAVNIEKWSERAEEDKYCTPDLPGGSTLAKTTTTGKPICWVCKRKFPSLEKLKLHEEKSTLHKQNMAKQKKSQSGDQPKSPESGNDEMYVDRAKQRRNMYGPDLIFPSAGNTAVLGLSTGVAASNVGTDHDSQLIFENSATNIGQQMLQKLGWESGASLGRGSEQQKQQQAALEQDWERIENLASQNQTSSQYRRRS